MFDFDKAQSASSFNHVEQIDLYSFESVFTIDSTNGINNGSISFVEPTESYQRKTHHLQSGSGMET